MSDEIKIEHKTIMCPDCSHVFTFSSTYKSEQYAEALKKIAELEKENERLKAALKEHFEAGDYLNDWK